MQEEVEVRPAPLLLAGPDGRREDIIRDELTRLVWLRRGEQGCHEVRPQLCKLDRMVRTIGEANLEPAAIGEELESRLGGQLRLLGKNRLLPTTCGRRQHPHAVSVDGQGVAGLQGLDRTSRLVLARQVRRRLELDRQGALGDIEADCGCRPAIDLEVVVVGTPDPEWQLPQSVSAPIRMLDDPGMVRPASPLLDVHPEGASRHLQHITVLEDGPALHDLPADTRGIPSQRDDLETANGRSDERMARARPPVGEDDVVVREPAHQQATALHEHTRALVAHQPAAGTAVQGVGHGDLGSEGSAVICAGPASIPNPAGGCRGRPPSSRDQG